jgi:hypothetical protein
METTTIEKVKKGDYFRMPNKKTVYVFDGYNRHTRKYSYYKYHDVNSFGEKKKGTIVEINFDF